MTTELDPNAVMLMAEEPLSLATFEPTQAQFPFLNTPRSLEACRRHGVNPVELVYIPLEEFVKNCPENPDAAYRRFERIDNLRKHVLQTVKEEWRLICETQKQRPPQQPSSSEIIIDVPDSIRSTALELQAAKFRRIETEEWRSYQRLLQKEMKHAEIEVRNRQLLERHFEWKNQNEQNQKEEQAQRQELRKAQYEARQRYDEARQRELRRLHEMEVEEERKKRAEEEEKARKEKKYREQREIERIQRELYTRRMKNSILDGIETKIDARRRAQETKDKEAEDRLREARELKRKQDQIKRKIIDDRLNKIKEDTIKQTEQRRLELSQKIEEDSQKRERLMQQIRDKRAHDFSESCKVGDETRGEKKRRVKDKNDQIVKDKLDKIKNKIEDKEYKCEGELEKIREAQERRRNIKDIKHEAFQMVLVRKKKAEQHRLEQLSENIRKKDLKSRAISSGYETLSQMAGVMREVMTRATHELKTELKVLYDKEEISPDHVVDKALRISDNLIFPKLTHALDPKTFVKTHRPTTSVPYGMLESLPGSAPSATLSAGVSTSMTELPRSEKAPKEGEGSLGTAKSTAGAEVAAGSTLRPNTVPARLNTPAVKIQKANKEDLLATLREAKMKAKALEPERAPSEISNHRSTIKKPPKLMSLGSQSDTGGPASEFDRDEGFDVPPPNFSQSVFDSNPPSRSRSEKQRRTMMLKSTDSFDHQRPLDSRDSADLQDDMRRGANSASGSASGSLSRGKSLIKANQPNFRPSTTNEFRRELSADHPLAGGTGRYRTERARGLVPASVPWTHKSNDSLSMERLTLESRSRVVDPQEQVEQLRKLQNEELLRVLQEERLAEESREATLRSIKNEGERLQLESVFAEERRRASDRIIQLTKENEARLKGAVLTLMELGGGPVSTAKQ